jgi:glycerol-3-phosphate dehydrogenase
VCHRLARQYGARVDRVLRPERGAEVAPGLYEFELLYLHNFEWARNADDVLWRRTKLGLHYGEAERAAVARWCDTRWPDHVSATPSSWS